MFGVYLFVQQTVDNEEERALLGVEDDEEHLEEEISLVQTQNPGAAQYDELGHDLEQNHSAGRKKREKNELIKVQNTASIDDSFTVCEKTNVYRVSLDCETSLFMLARVGRRLHKVAQNKIQLSCENKKTSQD